MFSQEVLRIDPWEAAEQIEKTLRRVVLGDLRRRGAVVGISGGIDSSVVATLCARALGSDRVIGLLMSDRDSSSDALRLGRMLAQQLGIQSLVEDVSEPLTALGCYERQTEAGPCLEPTQGLSSRISDDRRPKQASYARAKWPGRSEKCYLQRMSGPTACALSPL
jgi:NAD+ synthase